MRLPSGSRGTAVETTEYCWQLHSAAVVGTPRGAAAQGVTKLSDGNPRGAALSVVAASRGKANG
eukprot:CAMPEP_0117538024 /NCGR_PEP_ID=MMETSP0784-20121206/42268_1 /TAXON_ID=39447 /ORGANISM="" /LENGTH=63 /DNA_ID=CAMNT_0005334631 /DNA_START=421 /DNA_END=612 /DNA_ORIENTATION=+